MAAHTAASGQQLGARMTAPRSTFLAGSRLGAPGCRRVVLARAGRQRFSNRSLRVLSQSGGNGSVSTTYINDRGILVSAEEAGLPPPFVEACGGTSHNGMLAMLAPVQSRLRWHPARTHCESVGWTM